MAQLGQGYPHMIRVALAVACWAAVASASAGPACERAPERADKCFWARGRYSVWNGTPTDRIWIIGTHHVFGVEGPKDESDLRYPLPRSLLAATAETADPFSVKLYGDFRLCPFTRVRKGWMQYGCVAEAKRLIVTPR